MEASFTQAMDYATVASTEAASVAAVCVNDIKRLDETIQSLSNRLDYMERDNRALRTKVSMLETVSRKNNLVFRGIPEKPHETEAQCLQACYAVIEQMGFQEPSIHMSASGCSRVGWRGPIGGPTPNAHPRPIVLQFHSMGARNAVWDARFELRHTGLHVYIDEDFPEEIEKRRKMLYPVFKQARSIPKYRGRCSLVADSIRIHDKYYTIETLNKLPRDIHPETLSERTDGETLCFGGILSTHNPLSNFFPCEVVLDGQQFNSSEQAQRIANLNRDEWNDKRVNIMKHIIQAKFTQNGQLREKLISTNDLILVECNGRDINYANGLPLVSKDIFNKSKWRGKNELGEILMEVRGTIK